MDTDAASESADVPAPRGSEVQAPGERRTARVLVVDDEAGLREALRRSLVHGGYDATTVGDRDAAVAACRDALPDVVLSDLRMPGADGFDVLRAVHEFDAELPVIIVTGAEERHLLLSALRLGAFDFLQKPVAAEQLLESVGRAARQYALVREHRAVQRRLEDMNRALEVHLAELELDQRAGRRVQLGMLPPSPVAVGPVRLDHRIFPSSFLSGDFVDYFELTPEHLCFYVADVAGHGASSAFVTVLLKNFSRRLRREYRPDWLTYPGAILDWLNRELLEMELDKHVALFLGIVEHRPLRLHWANAGHFPPPVLADEQGKRTLEQQSPPLGLFPDPAYTSATLELSVPFTLTVCSDGILEILPAPDLGTREAALAQAASPQLRSVSAYLEALGLSEPQAAPDDVAVLLLSCRTAGGRPHPRH